jgi:hypothetical protein
MAVSYNNGRYRSEISQEEIAKDLATEMARLSPVERSAFEQIMKEMQQSSKSKTLQTLFNLEYKSPPVDLRTFVYDPEYLGETCDVLYPKLFNDLHELFGGAYQECILSGSIGWGKSYLASIGICYIIYLISLLRDPQKSLGLSSGSTIDIVVFSTTEELARKVAFDNIVSKINASPYFAKNFPYRETKKELTFPNNVRVAPRSTNGESALGLNVYAFFLDEADFMGQKKTKNTVNGDVDKAESIYNIIKRRMKSRFQRQGKLPGMMFVVSSKNTSDSFSARLIKQSMNDTTVFVRDYATWDVKPEHYFSSGWFHVLVGNEQIESKILSKEEAEQYLKEGAPEGCVFIKVPEDFRADFVRDLEGSCKDLAGIAVISVSPFIQKRDTIIKAVNLGKQMYGPSFTHPFTSISFESGSNDRIIWDRLVTHASPRDFLGRVGQVWQPIRNPGATRNIHIDPSFTNDCTGFCMAHVSGYKNVIRRAGDGTEYRERAPVYVVDLVLQITPPTGGEIMMGDVRQFVYDLSDHGFIIGQITSDTYQSRDGLQILSQKGYSASTLSVDKTTDPYDNLKLALYEERLLMYDYQPLKDELIALQRDVVKRKIDHPPNGSKDLGDALAGCLFSLSQVSIADPLPILKSSTSTGPMVSEYGAPLSEDNNWHDVMPAIFIGGRGFGEEE